MEPKFNTSFIPKKPVADVPVYVDRRPKGTLNIFSLAATLIFAMTLLGAGGVYLYKNLLTSQIVQADKDVNAARAAFETDKIQDLIQANTRIIATKNLLEKHLAVSQILLLLQSL